MPSGKTLRATEVLIYPPLNKASTRVDLTGPRLGLPSPYEAWTCRDGFTLGPIRAGACYIYKRYGRYTPRSLTTMV